jgi:membrane protein required for colicin V production
MASNWVDLAIYGMIISSVFAGLMRGFIKEILSLISWIVACFIASNFAVPLAQHFGGSSQAALQSALGGSGVDIGQGTIQTLSMLTIGASFACLFVGTLVAGSIISFIITSAMQATGVSITNRLLGAAFGFGRGCVLVVVFIFLAELSPLANQPMWKSSQMVVAFDPAVQWVSDTVSPSLEAIKSKASGALQGINSQVKDITNTFTGFGQ